MSRVTYAQKKTHGNIDFFAKFLVSAHTRRGGGSYTGETDKYDEGVGQSPGKIYSGPGVRAYLDMVQRGGTAPGKGPLEGYTQTKVSYTRTWDGVSPEKL